MRTPTAEASTRAVGLALLRPPLYAGERLPVDLWHWWAREALWWASIGFMDDALANRLRLVGAELLRFGSLRLWSKQPLAAWGVITALPLFCPLELIKVRVVAVSYDGEALDEAQKVLLLRLQALRRLVDEASRCDAWTRRGPLVQAREDNWRPE